MEKYLLNGKELQALRVEHRRQLKKNGRAADRVKVIYLLGSGWQVQTISEALLMDEKTIRSYYSAYQTGGIEELLQTHFKGREKQLTDTELNLLDEHLQEVTYLRVKDIVEYVKQAFDVDYSIRGLTDLLKTLNYRYKKPQKVPWRVDKPAQQAFIQWYDRLQKRLPLDASIYFMDAIHPQHQALAGCGWIKRGETKALRSNPVVKRVSINGAVNIRTLRWIVSFESRLNKETTKDFIEKLRKHQPKGKIYLICDNAGYYDSPEVVAYAASMAIEIVYLPPYSPNLNLIERGWYYFQKQVLYNRCYKTFEEMKNACWQFFRTISLHEDNLRSLLTEKFQTLPG